MGVLKSHPMMFAILFPVLKFVYFHVPHHCYWDYLMLLLLRPYLVELLSWWLLLQELQGDQLDWHCLYLKALAVLLLWLRD